VNTRVHTCYPMRTRVFTASSPRSPGIPTQWFTAYTVISLAIGLSCHHRWQI
jgi:hypothetical protein